MGLASTLRTTASSIRKTKNRWNLIKLLSLLLLVGTFDLSKWLGVMA